MKNFLQNLPSLHYKLLVLLFIIGMTNNQATLQAQTFNQVLKAVASDRDTYDEFGYSASISDDYAIVGAPYEDEDASGNNTLTSTGSAYIFKRDGGGNWTEIKKIVASDRAIGDEFGVSVSISGDYVIVGAFKESEDAGGSNTKSHAGSAYIFKKDEGGTDNWGETKKIVASDRAINDNFGWKVSISSDYVIVGVPSEDEDASGNNTINAAGSAYIFKKDEGGTDNWGQVKKIVASNRAADYEFGNSVSISGDYVIVGAVNEDEDALGNNAKSHAGSAYIFKKDEGGTDNWGQVKKIVASDRAIDDRLGGSVSISGDYVIVGVPSEDEDASGNNTLTSAGSAYIFKKDEGGTDNWGQIKKIVASDRADMDFFGFSVSISGDYAVVGAILEDEDASGNNTLGGAGSVYIFKKDEGGADNWGQTQKIVTSDRTANDYLGKSVSISNGYIITGAYLEGEDALGNNTLNGAGSAYFFEASPALPVELMSFTATPKEGQVLVNWITATELNNDYFSVEWSSNGEDFEPIGKIAGTGTTTEKQSYDFLHNSPVIQNSYHFRQVDFDGKFEYSDVISVRIEPEFFAEIQIFPNPVKDQLNVINGNGLITIYNVLGQPVKELRINNEESIDVADLPKGQYLLRIIRKNGYVTTQQFVK